MAQKQLVWEITGWDSTTKIFETSIPTGWITESKLKELLRALTVKYSLTESETVDCFLRKNAIGYRSCLEVRQHNPSRALECGPGPFFVARVRERKLSITD
jgi:hypothetical protein